MSAAKKKNYLPHFQETILGTPVTPLYSNLFNVIFFTEKGDEITDMLYHFFSYEKVVFGREPFIKTHYLLTEENLKIFDISKEICHIQVESHNAKGTMYLQQKFEVRYHDYQIFQNVNDENLQNITFIYKIIDQETSWTDYF